jgi:hypothetical protein
MVADYKSADLQPDLVARIRSQVRPALTAGIAPNSPAARPIVEAVLSEYQATVGAGSGSGSGSGSGERLIELLRTANDPRWARYLELLAVVNEWAPPEPLTPTYEWTIDALRHAG